MRKNSKHDRFSLVKRGYDPAAVEQHLEEIAAQNDATLDEAAAQIVSMQSEVEDLRSHEEAVHLTILAATETKDTMLAAAQEQADALRREGRKAGDAVITDARMQAFQLVTEARAEAESIVNEAMAEVAAMSRTVEPAPEPVAQHSDRERELEDRIAEMQTVIADMESHLRSRIAPPEAKRAIPEIEDDGPPPSNEHEFADNDADDAPTPPPLVEEHIEIVVTDTVPAEPTPAATEPTHENDDSNDEPAAALPNDDQPRDVAAIRRSFYSRRSAKLPRIGAEPGKGAMAAVAGLRKGYAETEAEENSDSAISDQESELETV
ncbi:MAG: DivIVA domain-containing protein [Actinomycetota bacterium]